MYHLFETRSDSIHRVGAREGGAELTFREYAGVSGNRPRLFWKEGASGPFWTVQYEIKSIDARTRTVPVGVCGPLRLEQPERRGVKQIRHVFVADWHFVITSEGDKYLRDRSYQHDRHSMWRDMVRSDMLPRGFASTADVFARFVDMTRRERPWGAPDPPAVA